MRHYFLYSTLFASAVVAACSAGDGGSLAGDPSADGGPDNGRKDGQVPSDGGAKPRALISPSHGSSVAVSVDDTKVVVANRDVGTVSVFSVDYSGEMPVVTKTAEVAVGAEPWQVVIHPSGDTAYVVVRKDQKVVRIDNLGGAPVKGPEVAVGAEPTGIAMVPTGATVWVSNMVEGTLTGIATGTMEVKDTIDLNGVIAQSGLLGQNLTARPALAHPRSIAITNNGDLTDNDESILVADMYAYTKEPLAADKSNIDTAKVGMAYKIPLATKVPQLIQLPPMKDLGFHDHNDAVAGCFPNEIDAVVIQGGFGYVTSRCASPRPPTGIFTGPAAAACQNDAQCPGSVTGSCVNLKCTTNCTTDAQCGANGGKCNNNVCAANGANIKATVATIVSIIDLGAAKTIATVNMQKEWFKLYDALGKPDDASRRLPLTASDVSFVPGTVTGYFTSLGTDAVYRVDFDATYATQTIERVGSDKQPFINLAPGGVDPSKMGRLPTGIAVTHKAHPSGAGRFAFVSNEATRNLSVLDLVSDEVAGLSAGAPLAVASTAMPSDPKEAASLEGKRLMTTGLGRWSWKGQGWIGCLSCHADGLSDNVTWFNPREPGQAPSFEGLYAKKDPNDVHINLWLANFDEVADHENAVRNNQGGVGGIVKDNGVDFTSRVDIQGYGQFGLNGSANAASDPSNPASMPNACVVDDWAKMMEWLKTVRSPRRPVTLDPNKVSAGKSLFIQGNCQGCHSGPKWTVSRVFYNPDPTGAINNQLKTKSWSQAVTTAGFPTSLLPVATAAQQTMRYGGTVAISDQLLCALRPVGTYNVAEPEVGILELRADLTTPSLGNDPNANGYNTPTLLGTSLSAPYFHAGQVRTLEGMFHERFAGHFRALSPGFLAADDPQRAEKVSQLVQFLLSIDGDADVIPVPPLGPNGGDFCSAQ